MASVSASDLKKCISKILKNADLTKLSSKMIRKRCEEQFKTDLSSRKQEVDRIVMSYISKASNEQNESNSDQDESKSEGSDSKSATSSENESSGKSDSDGNSSDSENEKHSSPPKVKKSKKLENSIPNDKPVAPAVNNSSRKNSKPIAKEKKPVPDTAKTQTSGDDAALAKQLQEEEWNFRTRSSRRGSAKKQDAKHKNEDKTKKPRKATGTYARKCILSPELAEIMESNEMARSDVVKKMWSIVRERDLFDPSNKQFAFCDDQLRRVFGLKRIRMFSMMKYLKNHVKDNQ